MALRRRPALSRAQKPTLYTAQDVAGFCEVDLKTVHHWADRGKIPHFRTDGRHLRFRRNDLVRFLRAHGYPMPEVIAAARPRVMLAAPGDTGAAWALGAEELAKKLTSRFSVRRLESGVLVVARLLAEEPDAAVWSLDDPSLGGVATIIALKTDPATAWIALAIVAEPRAVEAARDAGADVVLTATEVARLPLELGRSMAVG